MSHTQEVLADNVEVGVREKIVNVGDPPCHRILDGNHGVTRLARSHRMQYFLKRWAGERVQIPIGLAAGEVRVGAGFTLIGDTLSRGFRGGRTVSGPSHSSAALRRRAAMAGRF